MKRFHDTERLKDPAYRSLSLLWRAVYDYICDDCDRAGFWKPEFDVVAVRLSSPGEQVQVSKEEAVEKLRGLVFAHPCAEGLWQVKGFFEAQYPGQAPERCNNMGKAAFKLLDGYSKVLGKEVWALAGFPLVQRMVSEVAVAPQVAPQIPSLQAVPAIASTDAMGIQLGDGGGDGGGRGDGGGGASKQETYELAGGGPGGDCDVFTDVSLATLRDVAREHAYQWPPALSRAVVEPLSAAFEAEGPTRVREAWRAYLERFKGPKSLANFAQPSNMAYWLQLAPPNPATCQHRPVTAEKKLDQLRLGERERVTSCKLCKAVLKRETFRPPCDHGHGRAWVLEDHAEANVFLAQRGSQLLPAFERCPHCGAERPAGVRHG